MTLSDCWKELAAISDERMRQVNLKHGNGHGANLSKLRALAKKIKSNHELALELWATGDADARLLSMLIIKARLLGLADLDRVVHEVGFVKTLEWFQQHVLENPSTPRRCASSGRVPSRTSWPARAGVSPHIAW